MHSRFRRWTREGLWDHILAARKPTFDRVAYRRRHAIENCVGWLKEARGVATRFEKLAIHYLGLLKLGMIRMLLRRLLAPLPDGA